MRGRLISAYAGRMDNEPADTPDEPDVNQEAIDKLAVAEAKIAKLMEIVDAITAENQELKARNYDLLSKIPADSPAPDDTPTEQIISIDDLFEEED